MKEVFKNYKKFDNIFSNKVEFKIDHQNTEFDLRSKIANKNYSNYLDEVFKYHSICVMDQYVEFFLKTLKKLNCVRCRMWLVLALEKYKQNKARYKSCCFRFYRRKFFSHGKIDDKTKLGTNIFLHDDFNNLKIENNSFDAVLEFTSLSAYEKFRL